MARVAPAWRTSAVRDSIGESLPAAGSPYSTSPERREGAPAAPADDIYAFGVLLYELVSGHPPFYPDLTPERVRDDVPPALTGQPAPPAALRDLVASSLAKRPAERPASMREFQVELERCLEQAAEIPRRHPGLGLDAATARPTRRRCGHSGNVRRPARLRPASCGAKASAADCWSAVRCWSLSRSLSLSSYCRGWWPRGSRAGDGTAGRRRRGGA